jgi:hypothetical protein
MVYVINCDRKALMPCTSAIARLLLKRFACSIRNVSKESIEKYIQSQG